MAFEKLVLLWLVALVVLAACHDYEDGLLAYYAGAAIVPPLVVMTWLWLGRRETRAS